MKNLINRLLKPFNAEIHGKGYLQALANGDFNKDAFKIQQNLLQDSDVVTIFDLGANRGDTVQIYLELFPKCIVHAFEPFPGSFEMLAQRFAGNKRVILNMSAIASEEKTAQMFVNYNVDTNSLLKPMVTGLSSDKSAKNINSIDITTITIEQYCIKNKIEKIDILKMDIQGGEYAALQGGVNLINEKKIRLIYTESYFIRQYEKQPLFYEIAGFLNEKHYNLQDIYTPIYGHGSLAWCDAIFLPRNNDCLDKLR